MNGKILTTDEYYMAKALFTFARERYAEGTKFETLLAEHLKNEDGRYCGHISDAMFEPETSFEEAMKREGYTVEDE